MLAYMYSGTPLYRHPLITDIFVCLDGNLIFSLTFARLGNMDVGLNMDNTCTHVSAFQVGHSHTKITLLYAHLLPAQCRFLFFTIMFQFTCTPSEHED